MPFISTKQRKFMYAKHPDIAKRWTEEEEAMRKTKKKSMVINKKAHRMLKDWGE